MSGLPGRVLTAGAAALGALVVLGACSGSSSNGVTTTTVSLQTVNQVVEASGTIVPRAQVSLTAPATGTVATLLVADGAQVTAGQTLLQLSSPSAQSALASARQAVNAATDPASGGATPPGGYSAAVSAADASAAQAFAAAQQAAQAIPDPAVRQATLAQIQAAQAQYAAASADTRAVIGSLSSGISSVSQAASALSRTQRLQAQAQLTAAQEAVDALTVRAPVSGVVSLTAGSSGSSGLSQLAGQVPPALQQQAQQLLGGSGAAALGGGGGAATQGQLTLGAPVAAGQTLLTITDTSQISVAASVDESDILLVHPGVTADIQLDAVAGASYAGTVTAVDATSTPSAAGGVTYRVALSLGGGTLAGATPAPVPKPGMTAVVDMHVANAANVVAVPVSAVMQDGGATTVWVVTGGHAHRRPVVLGVQGDTYDQVTSGLAVGDTVVSRGTGQVTDGQQVS